MGLFSFFKPIKPVGFTYQPRFYDQKKEEFRERLQKAQERKGDSPAAIKARIRHHLQQRIISREAQKMRQQQLLRSNLLLLFLIVVLTAITLYAIEVYLPRIVHIFE